MLKRQCSAVHNPWSSNPKFNSGPLNGIDTAARGISVSALEASVL